MSGVCSCGEAQLHVIARRETADGIAVEIWDDGAVTGRAGLGLPGVPIARPRTPEARDAARRAAWLLAGEVCIHDAAGLGDLYVACRWVAARHGYPGDVRVRLRDQARTRFGLRPVWTVLSADRDGAPTERVWRLPRLVHPGLAVWDFCGSVGSARGRYVLMRETSGELGHRAFEPTGFSFSRLRDLAAHVESVRVSR